MSVLVEKDAVEGHRLWAASYDSSPNPLLALESRVLADAIGTVQNLRVLDAGCGTGRWMRELSRRGAHVFGIDACHEMIRQASGPRAIADLGRMPIIEGSFDLAICSFAIGYVASPRTVFDELARVARRVIISDMHPDAGWTRSFRVAGDVVHLHHYTHSAEELDDCAQHAGLIRQRRVEASFGEPERAIFERAGKGDAFAEISRIPAVLATIWRR
ncbi:MAG TPA: class I SAM-dependent methyltransferase [Bryobacteraceae bacterium]|nr:class I SAM-dependent methyltransferase [Bryobacteraceae bacterium]